MKEPSENPPPRRSSRIASWLKAGLTSLFGVVSGAALMYATTFVNKELAPPPPIANFQFEAKGLEVTFQNRSTGAHDGWWDFGDGTALVPCVPDQTLVHTYAKPGPYQVKLSLKNLIGDTNERAVTVAVDGGPTEPPSIDAFLILPVNGTNAPAMFQVTSKVTGATICVWSIGDRPLEIKDAAKDDRNRLLTFKKAGKYVVKLAATNGSQTAEKQTTVEVKEPPSGTVAATVAVIYEAVFVETSTTKPVVQLQFQQSGVKFNQDFAPDAGFVFVNADFDPQMKYGDYKSPPSLDISSDKKKLTISGELVNPLAKYATLSIPLVVTQQRVSPPAVKTADPVSVQLKLPGTTLVPLPVLPPGWVATKRTIALSLMQDDKHIDWQAGQLPQNEAIKILPGSPIVVSASEQTDQLRIDLSEVKRATGASGN
jgi:PKD repeat protein